MKSNRVHLFLVWSVCGALCLALLVALGGYFSSVESSGSSVVSEKRLLSQLKTFHEHLKRAESPEDAKAALKLLETLSGFGPDSQGARELKKAYSPVLSVFASKPREAEARFQYSKKRELMENLVNAYRKEIPNGSISVRAAYLNILFDTQSSLLNDTDETEQVYLKRSRERLDGLKAAVASSRDPGLPGRVTNIESIFQSYERGFQQGVKWRGEKADILAREEKSLPEIAKRIFSSEDAGVDDTRRTFLYICFISLLVAAVCFLTIFIGFKVLRLRFDLKQDAFLAYLRTFGGERTDPQIEKALDGLRDDDDWARMLAEAQRAEEAFLRSCQNLLAVPRSIRAPFFVLGKDKTVRYWNEAASALFGLNSEKEWSLQDILRGEQLGAREGETGPLLDLIRNSFTSLTEDRYELNVRSGGEWQPYELTMSPVTFGPLAGGKIFIYRSIRSEAERVDKSVGAQVERIREIVHKVAHKVPTELTAHANDATAVKTMLMDLTTLQRRTDERELLWKTEAQALIDQVSRQQEVLHKLSEELGRIRASQSEALELVRAVHSGEEHLHDEVCVMERDLERWVMNRRRLAVDLRQQAEVLDKVKTFEDRLRASTNEVNAELESYENELQEIRQAAEAARVHSVNLSLVRDPGYWEHAARARAFAHELARFAARAETLRDKVRNFLAGHPGGALAAHLRGPALDESVLREIAEEQERIAALLGRWKASGENLLSGGGKALEILTTSEKKGAVATQLGETSLLINEQARGNLERWS
ncbi:MAG TPA: hypothetical protein VIH99_04915 [Bdellovibrionota bacterium]|jgi:PAS domain-containing protein